VFFCVGRQPRPDVRSPRAAAPRRVLGTSGRIPRHRPPCSSLFITRADVFLSHHLPTRFNQKKKNHLQQATFVLYESASGYALFEGLDMDEIGQTQEAVQETIT
jgi:hypothetical protein